MSDSFYPSQGGCERVVAESSRALRRLGHTLVIVTGTEDRALVGSARWLDVDVVRYWYSSRNTAILNFTAITGAARAVSRVLRERGPFDLIHCHGVFGTAGVLLSRRGRSLPRLVTFHGPVDREFVISQRCRALPRRPLRRLLQGAFVGLYSRWLRAVQTATFQGAAVVVLSRYTARLVAERLHPAAPGRVRVIAGGVDLERFAPARDRATLRRALGLPSGGTLLLTVRRLVPRMGLDLLVDAIHRVRALDPNVHLVVGGRGPLEAGLRRQIESRDLQRHVTLAGYISEEALPLYYQCADLFVLPSVDLEGFGLVTLESLACGTPVLATRTGANAELLEGFGTQCLVDAPAAEELAKGILRFVDAEAADPDLRARSRRHAENYSWTRHAEQLAAVWAGVLAEVAP
jgi:glycosyltransferase involved in cell wall biosynthesis